MPSQPPGSALPAFEELLLQRVSPGQGAKALGAMALASRSFPCCISPGARGGKKERAGGSRAGGEASGRTMGFVKSLSGQSGQVQWLQAT